jgi:hypothetical protein
MNVYLTKFKDKYVVLLTLQDRICMWNKSGEFKDVKKSYLENMWNTLFQR